MIPVSTFAGRTVAVFGLGGSGLVTAQALVAGGAHVVGWDDKGPARQAAEAAGVECRDLQVADWGAFAALVLAPGVPLTHPKPHWSVVLAKQAGVEVIGDIELFCRERRANAPSSPFIAITGTNGKSTTTALVAHLLRLAGLDVQMGGNIGVPILALEPPQLNRHYVIEVSSYQIDLAPSLDPSIGVLLNITPDHIDRHGTFEHYAAVKERLIARSGVSIMSVDDAMVAEIFARQKRLNRPVLSISTGGVPGTDLGFDGRYVVSKVPGTFDLAGIVSLRGAHNGQNAMAAVAAARLSGCSDEAIQLGLSSFPGLPHRLEEVGRAGKVIYINDSKATNADSTEKALLSWERDIFWIAGGLSKEGGIESLRPCFGRVAKAYLIGDAARDFAAVLAGKVATEQCGSLDKALEAASRDALASPGREPVVLLSPACASFDQFRNFEERGRAFRTLVAALDGVEVRHTGGVA